MAKKKRTITVSGTGEIETDPDVAYLRIGVETEEESARISLMENSSKSRILMTVLENSGIPSENLRTSRLNISPVYVVDEASKTRYLSGYKVVNIVEVKMEELDGLGRLLDMAVEAGANTVYGIRFDVRNPAGLAEQVQGEAVRDARDTAARLAALNGCALGPVLKIMEEGRRYPGISWLQEIVSADYLAAETPPIRPGSSTISMTVRITWALQDISPDA